MSRVSNEASVVTSAVTLVSPRHAAGRRKHSWINLHLNRLAALQTLKTLHAHGRNLHLNRKSSFPNGCWSVLNSRIGNCDVFQDIWKYEDSKSLQRAKQCLERFKFNFIECHIIPDVYNLFWFLCVRTSVFCSWTLLQKLHLQNVTPISVFCYFMLL